MKKAPLFMLIIFLLLSGYSYSWTSFNFCGVDISCDCYNTSSSQPYYSNRETICSEQKSKFPTEELYNKHIEEKQAKEKQEAYLKSPEYLAEKQAELEKKQAEIEANQKRIELRQRRIEMRQNETKEEVKTMTQEEAKAFAELGNKAPILEDIAKHLETKGVDIKAKMNGLVLVFKESKDQYTKNIGIYMGYLLR